MKDINKIKRPKRVLELAGRRIEFEPASTGKAIELMEIQEQMEAKEIPGSKGVRLMLQAIADLIGKDNPDITFEWLMDNTTLDDFQSLVENQLSGEENKGTKDGEPAKN